MQTVLDAAYLWGGVALARRDDLCRLCASRRLSADRHGAACRRLRAGGAEAGKRAPPDDPLIRRLVYVWVAQNIVLVISSILRLDLYVGIYSLTYWRIAAFVWMGLVAAGLALIIVRIALEKSSEWLLSANLLSLSVTLYACSFINFAVLIANYNVEHSLEMTGQGIRLDVWYLRSLGPGALPALDRFFEHQSKTVATGDPSWPELAALHSQDEVRYRARQENWRAWSFRDWRLLRHLDTTGPFVVPDGSEPFAPGR